MHRIAHPYPCANMYFSSKLFRLTDAHTHHVIGRGSCMHWYLEASATVRTCKHFHSLRACSHMRIAAYAYVYTHRLTGEGGNARFHRRLRVHMCTSMYVGVLNGARKAEPAAMLVCSMQEAASGFEQPICLQDDERHRGCVRAASTHSAAKPLARA